MIKGQYSRSSFKKYSVKCFNSHKTGNISDFAGLRQCYTTLQLYSFNLLTSTRNERGRGKDVYQTCMSFI